MKYIGNKTRLLDFIETSLRAAGAPETGTFIDIFTGTTSVARHFKALGYRIVANDFMTYAFVMQQTYIKANELPSFDGLRQPLRLAADLAVAPHVLAYLNQLPGVRGYAFDNYAPGGSAQRQYFSDDNAQRIDAIRDTLEDWKKQGLVNEAEFYMVLASLIDAADFVANMSGTYGAYLKIWRSMALKSLELKLPQVISNGQSNDIYQADANKLITSLRGDILYLDPPYNSRQYAPNFHVLESLAVWDKQALRGKTGLRDYRHQKSAYSQKQQTEAALRQLVTQADARYIALSYNNEGLIPRKTIVEILSRRGHVQEFQLPYRRFRTERDHAKRQYKPVGDQVTEHLYIVKTSSPKANP